MREYPRDYYLDDDPYPGPTPEQKRIMLQNSRCLMAMMTVLAVAIVTIVWVVM